MAKSLLEICEPVFLYICHLRKLEDKGRTPSVDRIRRDVQRTLEDVRAEAQAAERKDPRVGKRFRAIEDPLVFYVDFMVKETNDDLAVEWKDLAYEKNALAGEERFFEMLDETLNDNSEDADAQLAVYYVCMGLGFSGIYMDQPELIQRKMEQCANRLRGQLDQDYARKIISDNELHINRANLIQPPGRSVMFMAVLLGAMIVALFFGNVYLFRQGTQDLGQSLDRITQGTPPAGPAASRAAPGPAPPAGGPSGGPGQSGESSGGAQPGP
jgi:type IV/VI secretion system ImpK/VasF family protein